MNPWNAADLYFDADTFSGVARLFPLPNLVLYPHVMQPLHIFEDRYREMLEDALAGDRLIAMALLEPGWETDYESRPPIAPLRLPGQGRDPPPARGRPLQPAADGRRADSDRRGAASRCDRSARRRSSCCARIRQRLRHDRIDGACRANCWPRFSKHLPCACQAPEQLRETARPAFAAGPDDRSGRLRAAARHRREAAAAGRVSRGRARPIAARASGEPSRPASRSARSPTSFRRHSASIERRLRPAVAA